MARGCFTLLESVEEKDKKIVDAYFDKTWGEKRR